MGAGAPLQRCDIVTNKRVHHVVGREVVVAEVLDPLYSGLQTGHARRGGLDGESFWEAHWLSVRHGVVFLTEPHKAPHRTWTAQHGGRATLAGPSPLLESRRTPLHPSPRNRRLRCMGEDGRASLVRLICHISNKLLNPLSSAVRPDRKESVSGVGAFGDPLLGLRLLGGHGTARGEG
jgi:hypothetical protein